MSESNWLSLDWNYIYNVYLKIWKKADHLFIWFASEGIKLTVHSSGLNFVFFYKIFFTSTTDVPGKVKTVAELEGELQKANKARTPPAQSDRASPRGGHNDLTAFNKLITLMQQGTARPVESPKLPVSSQKISAKLLFFCFV